MTNQSLNNKSEKVVAIIAAGGLGKRMGGPKQFLELRGVPILFRTIEVFKQVPAIGQIIVASAKESHCMLTGYCKQIKVVGAGPERQDSVANALKLVPDDADIVLIHDGARPLVTIEVIERVIEEAKKQGAAIAGVPAKDTIKQVDSDGNIIGTLNRNELWQAQTPQAFKWPILKEAYVKASAQGGKATDDAKLVEDLGKKVKIIMGSYDNIKITTPEDLVIAEAICLNRQNQNS